MNTASQKRGLETAETAVADLVFDFGLHKGEDTHFYLAKGYRVVAFEADPKLAAACREQFADEIGAGRLTIMEGAVAPASAGDEVVFYVSDKSVWGTTDPDWVERNRRVGIEAHEIRARRVDLAAVLQQFGVPHYMKIDIEGADRHVLEVLASQPARPQFISMESEMVDFDELIEELRTLRELGYRRFKAVQQEFIPGTTLNLDRLDGSRFIYTFPMDTSGPFGDEIPGEWLDFDGVVEAYRRIFRRYRTFGNASFIGRLPGAGRILWWTGKITGTALPGWYDTHARLD